MPMTLTRSILGILVPGIVATAPWLLILLQRSEIKELYKSIELPFSVLLLVVAVVAGAMIEGIGSHIEKHLDKRSEAAFNVRDNWFTYLAKSIEHEPVGFRYISRLATTLYFELSMIVASPIFLVGLVAYLGSADCASLAVASLLAITAIAYFYWQASCTHQALCETRKELNGRLP